MGSILPQRMRVIALFFIALFVIGTLGFMAIEQFTPLDAMYMTVLSVSTVGFGEVHPLSPAGRSFAIFIILVGVGTTAYFFGSVTEYLIAGELRGTLKARRIMRQLARLENHFIVCGFGRVGEQVATELQHLGLPFVVVDREAAAAARCEQRGFLFYQGDAEQDEVLQQVGIDRARGLVTVLSSDADNVFVVLSARALKKDLLIVARATTADAERKLLKAGADRVVSPYIMAGNQIVGLLVRPNVVHFLDRALLTQELGLWLEEIDIHPGCQLVGQSLAEIDLRGRTGATVLAIVVSREKRAIVQWSPDLRLRPHDVLIILGKRDQIEVAAYMAGDTRFARPAHLEDKR